jgi:hypothetical protein
VVLGIFVWSRHLLFHNDFGKNQGGNYMKFIPFSKPAKAIKTGLTPWESRAGAQYIKSESGRIRNHFKDLHKNRNPYAPNAPNLNNFNEVLDHWGITNQELPHVIKALQIQVLIYSIFWILAAAGIFYGMKNGSLFTVYNASLIFILSAVVIVCRTWRVKVLKNQQFVFFKDWIRGKESTLPIPGRPSTTTQKGGE